MNTLWPYLGMLSIILLMMFTWVLATHRRIRAIKNKQLNVTTIQNIDYKYMTKEVLLSGKSYDNQFQQPVLFIVLLSLLLTHHVEHFLFQLGTIVFVVSRYWHCLEHLKARNLLLRTVAFITATTTHWLMWLGFLSLVISGSLLI